MKINWKVGSNSGAFQAKRGFDKLKKVLYKLFPIDSGVGQVVTLTYPSGKESKYKITSYTTGKSGSRSKSPKRAKSKVVNKAYYKLTNIQ